MRERSLVEYVSSSSAVPAVVRKRAQALLLLDEGEPFDDIALLLQLQPRTLHALIRRHRDWVPRHQCFRSEVHQLSRIALLNSAPEVTVRDDAGKKLSISQDVDGPQPSTRNSSHYFKPGGDGRNNGVALAAVHQISHLKRKSFAQSARRMIECEVFKRQALDLHHRQRQGISDRQGYGCAGTAGTVDVVVTDGFTGNVALKTGEGALKLMADMLRQVFSSSWRGKLAYLLAKPSLDRLREWLDPRRYNGAVMVGLNGVVVKSHGGTDAEGFAHALDVAMDMVTHGFNARIREALQRIAALGPLGTDAVPSGNGRPAGGQSRLATAE